MKIAIIGGGWVGCHLAYKLQENHDVVIFEKNSKLFQETSYKNQNRLHLGYHYARSFDTRELCKTTFDRFLSDYHFATNKIETNLYCVAKNKSVIDFKTYLKIFDEFDWQIVETDFDLFEGCINTQERHIDFEILCEFFNNKLNFIHKNVGHKEIIKLQNEYDLVINATNNFITDKNIENSFYELTLSLIYQRNNKTQFDSLTVVDGDLFSIYPYKNNLFTVTDVEFTPIKKFKKVKKLIDFSIKKIDDKLIHNRKKSIEKKVCKYYPNFLSDFKYHSYFTSVKSKIKTSSDSRYPIISENGNLINCFTGKIQGIYYIEDYINKRISEKS